MQRIDLDDSSQVNRPDITVKLPRPKRKIVEKREFQPSSAFLKATDPTNSDETTTIVSETSSIIGGVESDSVETLVASANWGDFDVEKIVNTLAELSNLLTGLKTLPYQVDFEKRIYRSVLLNDGATISALYTRQSGKTFTVAKSCVTLCTALPAIAKIFPTQLEQFKQGVWIGIYAPSGEQANTAFSRCKALARSKDATAVYDDPDINVKLEKFGCRWNNGSYIFAQSASPKSEVESKTWHLLWTDEAQDMDEAVFSKSLEPMTAWNNGTIVATGTTSITRCLFYDLIQKAKSAGVYLDPKSRTHFECDWTEVVKYNPKYQIHINNMLKKHGESSRFFQMSYCLKWAFEEGQAISHRDLKTYMMAIKTGVTKYTNAPVVVGIDLARKNYGTVVTVGQLMKQEAIYEDGERETFTVVRICDWLEIERENYPVQRPMIKAFLDLFPNIVHMTVDSTGVGDAVYQEMLNEWQPIYETEPFIFTSKSKNYLMTLFYEFLYKNRIIVPSTEDVRKTESWQRFYLQMVNLEKVTKNGHTYLSKPERDGARDDYPDSLFLMLNSAKKASAGSRIIEESTQKSLFAPPSQDYSGIEDFRQRIREGGYTQSTLREQRGKKLLQGVI